MKRQFHVFVILLTVILGICSFADRILVPAVNATYVEGNITQNTIWTLMESPFIVTKDIIVFSNSTLTIEPGVEVKFGGAFSITVTGILFANGTDRTIIFTSNKNQPVSGDWDTIRFNGTQKSTLIGCSITYAKGAITIEDGDVEIEDSTIGLSQNGIIAIDGKLSIQDSTVNLCQQDGINITNSESFLQNNIITENQGNGICITGNRLVTIQKNNIIANKNGILLTGNEASNVNLNQNMISANTQDGIRIEATTHAGMTITNNTVSSNINGFSISSPTVTSITDNSISYNDIGFLYDAGNHVANYNDIYGNDIGMDVLFNATVNAEYNYWGSPNGPYHEIMNPDGRGNPVGGDGVNLDFIPFLTKPIGYINIKPTASLFADKTLVLRNETVTFFGANSVDADGRIDKYFFSFGDGSNSGWTTLSIFTHQYPSNGTYYANLRVMDDYGAISDFAATTINVVYGPLPPLRVNVELNNTVVNEGEQVSVTVRVTTDGITPVENAAVTLFSVKNGEFTQSNGLTDANGYFATTFTAPDVTDTANVRIVARASKVGFVDGSDYEYLEVLPFLSVQINAPSEIVSEEVTQGTILVSSNGQPVSNASLVVSSDFGNVYPQTGTTDANGIFQFIFTAPLTTETLQVTIGVTAKKSNYMNGAGQAIITVKPKVPVVQVVTEPNVAFSESKLSVTVHVEYGMSHIAGANVTIGAESGNFSMTTGLTDDYGNVTFVFTAPNVKEQTNINIIARATMTGYAEGQGQLVLTVNPRTFNIQITAPTIKSEDLATITVQITCNEDATPVADAIITLSSNYGRFDVSTKATDSAGTCTFIFYAPQTATDLSMIITANVTKNGYVDKSSQTAITVNPKAATEGGWSIITILLIIIPIVIVVIVVALIKTKTIVFSAGEGNESRSTVS